MKASYDPQVLHDFDYFTEEENQDASSLKLIENLMVPLEIQSSSFVDLTPNQGGYEEHMTFSIKNLKEDSISLKIRAVDRNNNYGEWSPVLTVKLNKIVKLSKGLKHYSKSQESQFLKTEEEPVEEKSFYWQLFIFLVGMYKLRFIAHLYLSV